MEILPLHKHTEFTEQCVEILNAQWPRSQAARIHGLRKSCDQLPVSLVLVLRNSDDEITEVKGYSKISAVQGKKNSCLVESVIIRLQDRGRGFGRILMDLTEEHARKLGVQTVYLNTLDKEGFYDKLGYIRCEPVISLGDNAHLIPESMLQHFGALLSSTPDKSIKSSTNGMKNCVHGSTFSAKAEDTSSDMEFHPHRLLHSPSVASPPPPPPPPPPPLNPKPLTQYSKAVVRMDPNSVIWMKKELL